MANFYIELGGGGGGSSMSLTIGTIDSVTPSANGLVYASNVLTAQSASATVPGMVNTTTQTMAGAKTFSSTLTVANLIDSGLTANTVPYADGSKQLTSSAVTPTELGYVSGVTSAIQTQLNAKQATITIGSVDTASNATVLTLSAGTLSIQSASTARAGIVTAAAQSLDGAKTFISTPVFSAGFTSNAASTVNGSADVVQFTVKGNGTQTANLENWTNSSNTVLLSVLAGGALYNPGGGSAAIPCYSIETGSGKTGMFLNAGAGAIAYNAVPVIEWSSTTVKFDVTTRYFGGGNAGAPDIVWNNETTTGYYRTGTNSLGISISGTNLITMSAGTFALVGKETITGSADVIQSTIKGNATQNANIIEIQKSDATVNFAVGNTGITKIGASSTTPQHLLNTTVKTDGNQVGTLTNAPSAGNPTGYVQITINGTTSYIPYWQ